MRFIISILLIFILVSSCKKKDECSDRVSQPLNNTVVKSIPYKSGQVVAFNTNKPETISTVVEIKSEVIRPSSPLVCEEYMEINLVKSGTKTNFISFIVRGSSAGDTVTQFDITPYGDFYNIIQFVPHENGFMSSFLFNGKSIFHDSYTLNNVSYDKVLELYWEDQENVRYINRIFYSMEFGVLRYETTDGLVGNLVPGTK